MSLRGEEASVWFSRVTSVGCLCVVTLNGVFNRVNAVFLFLLYDREGMVQVRFWHDDFYLTVFKNSSMTITSCFRLSKCFILGSQEFIMVIVL